MTRAIDKLTAGDLPATTDGKKKRIPRRIAEVCNLLLTGECKTVKAAARRVGMNVNYVYSALKKPEIRVFASLRARENLAAGTLRASARLLELMDTDSKRVAFEASRHVLAIDGIKPAESAQVNVSVGIRAGWIIDVSPEPHELAPVVDVTPGGGHSPQQGGNDRRK